MNQADTTQANTKQTDGSANDNITAYEISLPPYANELLTLIENNDYEAWCVGGFVRDALLGQTCHDVDIATNATWQTVQSLCEFAGLQTHTTGVKHGTITVVFPTYDNKSIEVTTYRADGTYDDGRHPENVTFVDTIEEDLARRDFTINALAYHPKRGILDPYGGLKDIHNKIIRTVGDPATRFSEDALRILRVCRFSSQLGFTIDRQTYQAMVSKKCLLRKVSIERITEELDRFLVGLHVHNALMSTVDVLSFVIPELVAMKDCAQETPYHIYDVLEHTAHVIENTPPNRLARWTALCHDMGKPAAAFFDEDGVEHFYGHASVSCILANSLMDRLNMSSGFKTDVLTLIKYHDDVIDPTPRSVKRALMRLDGNTELFLTLCDIKKADALSQAPFCIDRADLADNLKEVLQDIIDRNEVFSLRDLAINGNNLIESGISQGPRIGYLLEKALEAVVAEEIPNEKEALLAYVSVVASTDSEA